MMRYSMVPALVALAVIGQWASIDGFAQDSKPGKGTHKPPYAHTVIISLKKDAPKDEAENLIADCHKLLSKIPSVRGLWVGRPVEKSSPKLAITDYDVGLLVLFENFEGLQVYQDHPLHKEFVSRHSQHMEKVQVYDFMNQKK